MFPQFSLKGIGLVEVVIGIAILTTIVVGVLSAFRIMVSSSGETIQGLQAQALLEEGLEAVRLIRDGNWSNISSLTTGTSYTLTWNGSLWTLTTTPATIDALFDRRVSIGQVYRDANDDIATSGTLDPNTKKVTVTISWNRGKVRLSRSLSTYITNIFE